MQALPGSRKGAVKLRVVLTDRFCGLLIDPKLKFYPLRMLASKELVLDRRMVSLAPENTLTCFGE